MTDVPRREDEGAGGDLGPFIAALYFVFSLQHTESLILSAMHVQNYKDIRLVSTS
jgi:hypothetical protein